MITNGGKKLFSMAGDSHHTNLILFKAHFAIKKKGPAYICIVQQWHILSCGARAEVNQTRVR